MLVPFLLHTFPIIVPFLLALCTLRAVIVDCVEIVVRKGMWFWQSVPSFTSSVPYTKIRLEQARCLLALSPGLAGHVYLCVSSFMTSVFICALIMYMWDLLYVNACWWGEQSYRHMFALFSSDLAASCSPDLAAGAFVKCPHASFAPPQCQACTLLYFSLYPNHSPPNFLSVFVQFVLSSHSGRSFDIKNVMHSPLFDIFLCLVLPHPSVFSPSHHCYYFSIPATSWFPSDPISALKSCSADLRSNKSGTHFLWALLA